MLPADHPDSHAGPTLPPNAGGNSGGDDHGLGLRERKRRATEEALRRATIALAMEHGFDAVTVEEICTHVGVSPRTFFNYFTSKEDAVLQARPTPPRGEDLDRFTAGGPTGNLLPDLAAMIGSHLTHHLPPASDLIRHHDLLSREPRLQAHFRGGLREVEEGLARAIATRLESTEDTLAVQVLAATVSAAVRVAMMRWVAAGGDPGVQVHVDETFDLLDRALAPEALIA